MSTAKNKKKADREIKKKDMQSLAKRKKTFINANPSDDDLKFEDFNFN